MTAGLALCLSLAASEPLFGQMSHGSITWRTPDGSQVAVALEVSEFLPESMVSRTLVEAPDGQRLVLTEMIDSRTSIMIKRLAHEESGWWLQIEFDHGFEASGLKDFFNQAHDLIAKTGARVHIDIRSSDDPGLARELVVIEPGSLNSGVDALARQLAQESFGEALRSGLPPELIPALHFLNRELKLGMAGEGYRMLIDFMAAFLPAEKPSPFQEAEKLIREDGEFTLGLDFAEPRFSELLERFPSIDPRDPTKIQ